MEVKNLFDQAAYDETVARLHQLHANSERLWGKMNVSQMLAHCQQAFKVPLTSKKLSLTALGLLFGWMMKSKLYNESPWGKSLPTARNFIIKDERDFEKEKAGLLSMINSFHQKGASGIGDKMHPMFGKIKADNWGKSMWKHLDHHLRQFGV